MRDHRKLVVWQKAYELAHAAHRAATAFPKNERFGLTVDVQRRTAEIPSHIAESCVVDGVDNIADCLQSALTSATELKFQLGRARKLDFLPAPLYNQLEGDTNEVERMLETLIGKLKQR